MRKVLERCGQVGFTQSDVDVILGTGRCTSCGKVLKLRNGKLPTHGRMVD